MLAILDYGAGNQTSVRRALEHLGIPSIITANPEDLGQAQGVIFPGVGAARQAMASLTANGLDQALKEVAARNQPLLGICLGCQILLESSEEENTPTLSILPGSCHKFNPAMRDGNQQIRIPHMGWNRVRQISSSPIWTGVDPKAEFYFVHSYFVRTAPELALGITSYGEDFCSVYGRGNIWAAQFHPEKSGRAGLQFLENFYGLCRSGK